MRISESETAAPKAVERAHFQAELDVLRVREKAHTRAGDEIAAARRRLPMVAVDGATRIVGKNGPTTLLDAFEGRRMLIAYYYNVAHRQAGSKAMPGMHMVHLASP
ncbi:DUF899 family protein [Sphingomonas sp. DT-207]|uniref:DUF899 family protein n=1 Tax=Sphingomonas sp. DT-207 TaxID=3396167 RepID=UPI003F19A7C9